MADFGDLTKSHQEWEEKEKAIAEKASQKADIDGHFGQGLFEKGFMEGRISGASERADYELSLRRRAMEAVEGAAERADNEGVPIERCIEPDNEGVIGEGADEVVLIVDDADLKGNRMLMRAGLIPNGSKVSMWGADGGLHEVQRWMEVRYKGRQWGIQCTPGKVFLLSVVDGKGLMQEVDDSTAMLWDAPDSVTSAIHKQMLMDNA